MLREHGHGFDECTIGRALAALECSHSYVKLVRDLSMHSGDPQSAQPPSWALEAAELNATHHPSSCTPMRLHR